MSALHLLAAIAIVVGFLMGRLGAHVVIIFLVAALFIGIGFIGIAIGRWPVAEGLKIAFATCFFSQACYFIGGRYGRNA